MVVIIDGIVGPPEEESTEYEDDAGPLGERGVVVGGGERMI